MTSGYYILKDGKPVRVDSLTEWCVQFERGEDVRRVDQTYVGYVWVSTVFLGLDHNYGDGPPLIFETMVFGGPLNEEMVRYSTLGDAKKGHFEMVDRVRAASPQ